MEKNRGKIRAYFWIAVIVISALFGISIAAFDPDASVKKVLIASFLGAVALISIAIDLLWYREFNQKLDSLQSVLLQEHDADGYIREINTLMAGKQSTQIRNVLLLNLSPAYCEKQEYGKAKEILLQVNSRKLTGRNRCIYWADFAYVYFYLKENEQANAILAQQKVVFCKFSEDPGLGALIQVLRIFQMLSEGDRSGAQMLLERARPQWENEHTASDFIYLENQIKKSFP